MQREPEKARKALEIYLSLGPARSLVKLVRKYTEIVPGEVLPLPTVKYWSRHYGWASQAQEHDQTVQEAVKTEVMKQAVQERVDGVKLCDSLLFEGVKMLEQFAQRETPLRLDTPQDMRAFVSAMNDTIKVRELLEGNATSRHAIMTDEEIETEIAAYEAERETENTVH